MANSSWLRMLTGHRRTVHRQRARRLELETLEGRALPSGTTFVPVVAASIHDEQLDGQGDSFNTVFNELLWQNSSAEDRAVVEFDLASVTDPVNLAVLDFNLAVNSQGTPLRVFDVFVYAANGQRDLSDFSVVGTKVGTVTLIGSEGGDTYRLDVTSAVLAVLGGGSMVGVRVDLADDSTPSLFLDASLTINGAPAPNGQRGWESVPNAIRMDGSDSFRVEVDVGGAVKGVTLDPFSSYLVPPNSGTVVLQDDGLDGDRVAGDFIYTSGAFHYDASKTWPNDFYQGDPNSPAGVHIEDVGDIKVTELDDTISTFLLRPAIGLVRADLPLAPSVQVAPNIVTTEHLINVSTDAHATQRSLRGPADVLYQVTKPIYAQFRDSIDSFMFFSTNKVEQLPSRSSSGNFNAGRHFDAKVDYTGTGRDPFDNTVYYGSAGRLQGLNMLDTYQRGLWGANATHELTHQWSAYIDTALGVTDGGGHFDNHSNAGSLVGGFQWTANVDGSYTINFNEGRNGATHAPEIDLYMMGLLDAAHVSPLLAYSGAYKSPGNPVVQANEIVRTVTIQDIIARHGARTPAPSAAQHDFNLAFVAESHNRLLTPVELTFYEAFAAQYTKPIPGGQPDPYIGDGWQSIARYFGHGSTWSGAVPLSLGLSADIVDVAPDPRATPVSQISIAFSDPVTGVDVSDLRLTRDGGNNLLTGNETLSSPDGITWTLSGLSGLSGALGNYQLTLVASGSGIESANGNLLVGGAFESWSKVPLKVTLTIGSASLAEAGGTALVTAALSDVSGSDVSVNLGFTGSATLDGDYTRSAALLTIPAGQTQASLTLTATQDTVDEDDETVVVDIASVTGAVEDGMQQVTATITDDDTTSTVSFSSSNYTVGEANGSKTITVNLSAASDKTVTVNYATSNGTASSADYTATSGTLSIAPGATSGTFSVPINNDSRDENDETVNLTLSNPSNASLGTPTATLTISDDDAAPTVSFSSGSYTVGEASGTKTIAVNLSTASGKTVTVNYATSNGTASSADYTTASGTLSIAPGATSGTFSVPITNDGRDENDETVNLTLSNPSNASLGTSSATLTIIDDDPLPKLTISDAVPDLEGNVGNRSQQFVVQLSAVSGRTVTVNYATAAATATSGVDYVAASGTVTFAPGETTKTITIQVIGDRVAEANESLVVNISSATNATLADGQGVGTILNDEPRISINNVAISEGRKNQSTNFVFTVTLSAAYDQAVTMSFQTVNGTATTSDNDYVVKTGTLTFAPGQTTKTISIQVNGDNKREADETFYLDLFGNSSNSLFTKNRGIGTILNDD